ncbi:MAG TPA: GH3 auxin-responsive promoter family protein [Pyrinomonadaceae bacterium]|nr:GH3 auxin-responsive promoter family protein [Pyrinomonadaceae bacterium]
MRGLINDCIRRVIALGIEGLGLVLTIAHRIRVDTFFWSQRRLKRKYGITSDTPVLTFGPELEVLIDRAAARAGRDAKFAWTSGSTAAPKRILYTKDRLRKVKLAYVDFVARCCWSLHVKRSSLYVFSSLSQDDSLTSMLLEEKSAPDYFSSLQAPYRVHCCPSMRSLVSEYGATAVRLWVLAIANPGILYSTNPSTLSTFLDELATAWPKSSRLVRDWCRRPEAFDQRVHAIARRLDSRGSHTRLAAIAASELPLSFEAFAPAAKIYICWAGGYVKSFLDRLKTHLPPERYQLVPMYSMSTETLETVGNFTDDTVTFLPMAPKVLYEFIDEQAANHPPSLLTAAQLETGKIYSMVVSDAYGLRRYQTGDLFLCRGFVRGLPDLSFVSRRDLEYSFTGEKLTADNLMTVFQKLRREYPQLSEDKFLTCVPSHPIGDPAPHYKIVMVNGHPADAGIPVDEVATRCNDLLGEINCEYKSKFESGRLGATRFILLPWEDFINRVSGARIKSWETQFKFLPLFRNTWESLSGASRAADQSYENPGPG